MNFPTSQTPPPPFAGQTSMPPVSDEPAAPALSEPQRLINVFIAPSKTFTDLKRNSSWWVPWLIGAVFSLIFAVVAVQKIDMVRFVQHEIDKSPSAQKRLEQATPEQRAQGIALQATITKVVFYIYPVFTLIGCLIIAAILMGIFNFMLGAEVPFQRALAVVFYAGLPGVLAAILLTISVATASDPNTIDLSGNPMPTNPAFFMDPQGNQFIYTILKNLDIFRIWFVALLGLGFSAASSNRKPSTSTGLTTMFVVFAILVLASAAWKAAF